MTKPNMEDRYDSEVDKRARNLAKPNTALREQIAQILCDVASDMFYETATEDYAEFGRQAKDYYEEADQILKIIQDNQTDLRSWFSQPFDYRTALVTIEDGELGTIARIPYLELEKKILAIIQDNQEPISVNRVEVIDHTQTLAGRDYTKWEDGPFQVEFSKQDGGRTLKIFLSELEEEKTL